MIEKAFDKVTAQDVRSLIDSAVPEGRTLEYKEKLPGGTDAEKREFLADISSFANASGGELLYGIEEKEDNEGKNTGEPARVVGLGEFNADQVRLRLDQVIRDGIEPRIPVVRMRVLDGFAEGPVFLVRVGQSWLLPHMVTFKNWSRFFSRNSAGKYQLDVTELRSAFLLSEGAAARPKRFRDDRLAKIVAGETPAILPELPKTVLHIFPVQGVSLSESDRWLAAALDHTDIWPMNCRACDPRYNLDGVLRYGGPPSSEISRTYVQVFRDGTVEAVESGLLISPVIQGLALEEQVMDTLAGALSAEQRFGVEPPFVVMLSLIGAKGHWISSGAQPSDHKIDRDLLLLPDILIESYQAGYDVALRPAFDALWQASGHARCPNYNRATGRHGRFRPRA